MTSPRLRSTGNRARQALIDLAAGHGRVRAVLARGGAELTAAAERATEIVRGDLYSGIGRMYREDPRPGCTGRAGFMVGTVDHAALSIVAASAWRGSATKRFRSSA